MQVLCAYMTKPLIKPLNCLAEQSIPGRQHLNVTIIAGGIKHFPHDSIGERTPGTWNLVLLDPALCVFFYS